MQTREDWFVNAVDSIRSATALARSVPVKNADVGLFGWPQHGLLKLGLGEFLLPTDSHSFQDELAYAMLTPVRGPSFVHGSSSRANVARVGRDPRYDRASIGLYARSGSMACCRFRGRPVKLIRPSFRTQPG
jgi:hypothetical protein